MCFLGWIETCFNTLINSILSNDFEGKVEAFTIFKEIQNILTASVAVLVGINVPLEYILWSIAALSLVCYPFTWIYKSKKETANNFDKNKGTTLLSNNQTADPVKIG